MSEQLKKTIINSDEMNDSYGLDPHIEFFVKENVSKSIDALLDSKLGIYNEQNEVNDDDAIAAFINNPDANLSLANVYKRRFISLFLSEAAQTPELFDDCCQFNIGFLRTKYSDLISDYNNKNNLIELFYITLRFAVEYKISSSGYIENELEVAIDFISINSDVFEHDSYKIKWIFNGMPIGLMRKIYNKTFLKEVRQVSLEGAKLREFRTDIKKEKSDWLKGLDERERRIKDIEFRLDNAETQYNFVGLTKAFVGMSDDKKKELKNTDDSVRFWRVTSILVPMVGFTMGLLINTFSWQLYIPLLSTLVLTTYFYRVSLLDLKSLKTQLAQLEHRKALCQFIQKYAEYSKEIKDNNGPTLNKFEDIIFSGIVLSDDKIPSTFDGMEKLEKLLKAIKN